MATQSEVKGEVDFVNKNNVDLKLDRSSRI